MNRTMKITEIEKPDWKFTLLEKSHWSNRQFLLKSDQNLVKTHKKFLIFSSHFQDGTLINEFDDSYAKWNCEIHRG